MAYGTYGMKMGNAPQEVATPPSKGRAELEKAIKQLIKKELTPVDHNAMMSQGKWLFGPHILGNQ